MDILELIGYLASLLVAISLTMSSIVRLRWINTLGAITFVVYGLLIGALPVALMNLFIVGINAYYLYKMYTSNDYFHVMELQPNNEYLAAFLDYHHKDLASDFPGFVYQPEAYDERYLILRNMAVAGVFLARRKNGQSLQVLLDYVIPEYRDFKPGRYLYHHPQSPLRVKGFQQIYSKPETKQARNYFKKMRFQSTEEENTLVLTVNESVKGWR